MTTDDLLTNLYLDLEFYQEHDENNPIKHHYQINVSKSTKLRSTFPKTSIDIRGEQIVTKREIKRSH